MELNDADLGIVVGGLAKAKKTAKQGESGTKTTPHPTVVVPVTPGPVGATLISRGSAPSPARSKPSGCSGGTCSA